MKRLALLNRRRSVTDSALTSGLPWARRTVRFNARAGALFGLSEIAVFRYFSATASESVVPALYASEARRYCLSDSARSPEEVGADLKPRLISILAILSLRTG